VDDLSAILGPDTARLVPLLRNLHVSLSGPGASLLPFRHLPPSEAGILLLEMCSALVAGECCHSAATLDCVTVQGNHAALLDSQVA
jgi:hypothetical protein